MRTGALPEKERIILGLLLAHGPMYGLEMVKASQRGLKRGTVYVTLGRMEEKGYVETAMESYRQPPRRRYIATDRGRRVYDLWQELGGVK